MSAAVDLFDDAIADLRSWKVRPNRFDDDDQPDPAIVDAAIAYLESHRHEPVPSCIAPFGTHICMEWQTPTDTKVLEWLTPTETSKLYFRLDGAITQHDWSH